MDPNETLIELRQTLADMPMLANDLADRFEAAQELFTSLDQWLSKGGFFPSAWGERSSASALDIERAERSSDW